MNDDTSLAPAAAAKRLGIGLKKLRTLGLPNVGTATRKRYLATDLDAWLAANGTESERRAARASAQFTVYRRWTDEHGRSRPASAHPYWNIWQGICARTDDLDDPDYGGRGITMYPEWREDPVAFYEYVEGNLGPRSDYVTSEGVVRKQTIDRAENDGNYWPDNLQWATAEQQNGNRRSCLWARITCICHPDCPGADFCSERQLWLELDAAWPLDLTELLKRIEAVLLVRQRERDRREWELLAREEALLEPWSHSQVATLLDDLTP